MLAIGRWLWLQLHLCMHALTAFNVLAIREAVFLYVFVK